MTQMSNYYYTKTILKFLESNLNYPIIIKITIFVNPKSFKFME